MTDGFEAAIIFGAVIAAAGILVGLFLVRPRDLEGVVGEEPEPVLEAAA